MEWFSLLLHTSQTGQTEFGFAWDVAAALAGWQGLMEKVPFALASREARQSCAAGAGSTVNLRTFIR